MCPRGRVLLAEAAEALRNRWTAPPVDALIAADRGAWVGYRGGYGKSVVAAELPRGSAAA
ncbi:MAG TPA: hypothetical protein VLK57_15025 [Pseudonocardia sp.]|jgi:hypothetical protein|nr:hypothetical protein [Pseudonocardia sp.]